MQALRARVENGHIVLNEPTDLPDGTELYLIASDDQGDVVFDANDGLSADQRASVHQQIVTSIQERRAGAPTFDADEVMIALRSGS
jgi:hypothetical protein